MRRSANHQIEKTDGGEGHRFLASASSIGSQKAEALRWSRPLQWRRAYKWCVSGACRHSCLQTGVQCRARNRRAVVRASGLATYCVRMASRVVRMEERSGTFEKP